MTSNTLPTDNDDLSPAGTTSQREMHIHIMCIEKCMKVRFKLKKSGRVRTPTARRTVFNFGLTFCCWFILLNLVCYYYLWFYVIKRNEKCETTTLFNIKFILWYKCENLLIKYRLCKHVDVYIQFSNWFWNIYIFYYNINIWILSITWFDN